MLPCCWHSTSLLVIGSLVRSYHKNNHLLKVKSSVLPLISPPASLSQKGKAERAPLSALPCRLCDHTKDYLGPGAFRFLNMVFHDKHPTVTGAPGAQPRLHSGDTAPPGLIFSLLSMLHTPSPNPEASFLLATPSRCLGRDWPLQTTAPFLQDRGLSEDRGASEQAGTYRMDFS